ncbi:MAG: hypothetical protein ACM3PF_09125 [Bacteroidota bacterium]
MKRVVRPGFLVGFAAVLPILVLASACSRDSERRVVAPNPLPDSPQVTSAHWVWETEALAGAVQSAGKNPLVQRALAQAPIGGLRPRFDLAVHAVGEVPDVGGTVGLTILPYATADPTHAAFVSVARGLGSEAAEFAEMIVGREPGPSEIGFHSVVWGDQVVWVRSADAYVQAAGGTLRSPIRKSWTRLFDCLANRMPAGCAAGSSIASEIAPGSPHAAAIGCGVGAALGAASCALDFIRGK